MNSINHHRETALAAYTEAINQAERTIQSEYFEKEVANDRDWVLMLLDLAELHIQTNKTGEAEAEFLEALDYFQHSEDILSIEYQIYIYKALSGLHTCMGRAKEGKKVYRKAEKLEEKLLELSSSVTLEKNQ